MTCPPGVICIENFTLLFFFALAIGAILYSKKSSRDITIHQQTALSDPYSPPLQQPFNTATQGIPINIPTRQVETSYKQVGFLTRISGKETILPLMGRPLYTRRSKWQYYTMSNELNSIRLPISRNGRSCTSEQGCDDLYNGDTVFVEGYNDAFKVVRCEHEKPRYIPIL